MKAICKMVQQLGTYVLELCVRQENPEGATHPNLKVFGLMATHEYKCIKY